MSDVPIVLFCCENGWNMTSDRYMTRDSLITFIVLRQLRFWQNYKQGKYALAKL